MYRHIAAATVFIKDSDEKKIIDYFAKLYSRGCLFGVNIGQGINETFAQQLLSLADQPVHERIVDHFIQEHAQVFARALGYVRALPQRPLTWVQRNPKVDPSESIPDYLLEKGDGYYDILDLKRGLLPLDLVKQQSGRNRFCDYGYALIRQLGFYGKYFESQQNAQWAQGRYGVRVRKPLLLGVVGNFDSFDHVQVQEELRQFRGDLVLMSYADVVDLLRGRASRAARSQPGEGNRRPHTPTIGMDGFS
jgi:hypothetical protein